MRTYTLSENYQIVKIEAGGNRIELSSNMEGIKEQDFVYLTDHQELKDFQYEVVKVRKENGLLHADLVRIPS